MSKEVLVVIGTRLGKGQAIARGVEKAGGRAHVIPGMAADMKLGDVMNEMGADLGISQCGSGGAGALAALDALFRVNVALAVDEGDCALGTDPLAGSCQTVLAVLRHPVLVSRAGVAGIGNDIDERRLVILLGDGGGIHALGHQAAGLDGADGQAHSQPHPLTRNGAL